MEAQPIRLATEDRAPATPDLTIIIPAYNEERAIAAELDHLHRVMEPSGYRYQLIVVDDGSADDTAQIAESRDCLVIRQPRNFGYGASLKRGIREAQSELVVITDADGTYPAEEIPRLLEETAHFDMVVGARTGANLKTPFVRRLPRWFLRVLASYLAGVAIPDLNSGLRVIRRSHVRRFAHLLPSGFSFTTTITLACLCSELTVGYLPIHYKKRIGASKIRWSHASHFLILVLRLTMLFNPLKVFLPLGLLLFSAGLGFAAFDYHLATLGFLAALISWAVGLLADQSSKLSADRERWE